MSAENGEVTLLLKAMKGGDKSAAEKLLPLVYNELHRLARSYMQRERSDHTLQPTALINEAYLRLEKQGAAPFQNRAHFLAICALLMRQILVEYARNRSRVKRDGGDRVTLDGLAFKSRTVDMVALDDALNELAKLDAQQSRIVELRFFGGLSVEEASDVLGLSPRTVKRHWASARAWLHRQISATSGT